MDRALPAPLDGHRSGLRLIGLTVMAAAIGLNFYFLAAWLPWAIRHGAWDYPIYVEATTRLFDGTMYDWGGGYIYPYSPVFAWLMAPLATLGGVGFALWRLAHVIAVLTIPSWPIRLAILLSWPFINDTWEGNVNTFMAVAGYWAVRQSRVGGWAYVVFAILVPKPILIPGLVWLLWHEPSYRKGFAALVIAHGLTVLATGYAFDWLPGLVGATHDMNGDYNFMPSVWIGWWWMLIALPLAAWLTWQGRIGWASVVISPYAAGTAYLLWLVLERQWPRWLMLPWIRERQAPSP